MSRCTARERGSRKDGQIDQGMEEEDIAFTEAVENLPFFGVVCVLCGFELFATFLKRWRSESEEKWSPHICHVPLVYLVLVFHWSLGWICACCVCFVWCVCLLYTLLSFFCRMEEAEALSTRIGIMVDGRLQCKSCSDHHHTHALALSLSLFLSEDIMLDERLQSKSCWKHQHTQSPVEDT